MKEGKGKNRDREKDSTHDENQNSRNAQMHRLKHLIDFLSSSANDTTTDQLLQHLLEKGVNCSKRTLCQDLEALQSLGCPITETSSNGAWHFERQVVSGHSFPISPKALVGLYTLKKHAATLTEGPFAEDLREFFSTLDERVGEKGRQLLNTLTQSGPFPAQDQMSNETSCNILRSIRSACTNRQVLEVEYETINCGIKKRRIGPQNIYYAQGSFHLIAEDLELKKTKTFAMPRFRAVVVLAESYDGVTTAPDEMLSNSFAIFMGTEADKIELVFNKELAPFVTKSRWHSSQTIKSEADGRVRLRVNLAVSPDFVAWVMSFGDKVEIVSPLSLSQEIERQVFNMAERFQLKQVS